MKIKTLVLLILVIVTILLSIYLKMKYDEKKVAKEKYYNQQKDRIELFMKYNVKGYKDTHFTKIERNPMDGYDISGYVNSDKDKSFNAGIRSTEDFQFDGDITSSNNLEVLYHNNIKSVSEIKKEQKNKQNEN
ncbi:DUF1433 domain-containing protein [Staphylococcus epidermidis]|uniref:DUF1433 domain-containing protein n=1 Tax=Staphylococcus epidermidis TaxID=1282 RepID=UPI00026C0C43|nr:DUF1433 domain-containing protein [Staphylococcus epidermidis]EJD91062.1 hypothetical protein HMPREF9989_11508 [Staphylococcus epidermidis NIHLM057]EJD95940.1 hypothetical protein HMPREF9988_06212 [Staphylococcus epidermidis NIHLM053]MCG1060668.1 DUF1433 domain-containing protein [Staphylococcus epidermidis]MCG1080327.1 DUF1433 domain-containing protein [Staphylococcus epidermidis]MCG1099800.1 DUF1433 domain-containing protein [Staphylococcus epidermidis]